MGVFAGPVAVVSGAAGTLGRAYCRALALAGFAVLVNGRGRQRIAGGCGLDAVADEIERAGGVAAVCRSDVSAMAGAEQVVAAAMAAFGRVDAVVCNAGVLRDRPLAAMGAAEFDEVVRSHLYGTFHLTKAAWGALLASGAGRVVTTTSSAGLWGNPGQSHYAAAKLGVVGFTLSLALEGAPSGVRVNAVAPLATCRATGGLIPEAARELFSADQVAELVVRLAGAGCTSTGRIWEVGGGVCREVGLGAGPYLPCGHHAEPVDRDQELTDRPLTARSAVADLVRAAQFRDGEGGQA
ncbi:SDR family NAD(P)-dependent oxidoreductase [Longispora sp. NPDC051575]|uniref:SDR family NAD(P)-dependent oxidoreductase n=1 Tax=Longispora sp. NPDC051575 TaxID=3154943 RepID=UPI003419E288